MSVERQTPLCGMKDTGNGHSEGGWTAHETVSSGPPYGKQKRTEGIA
jgi:hypothetical protein